MGDQYEPHEPIDNDETLDGSNTTHGALIHRGPVAPVTTVATKSPREEWLNRMIKEQFPPENLNFLASFERSPDSALRKSYLNGIMLPEVKEGAHVLKIGIVFMAGGDKPAVVRAETSRLKASDQQKRSIQDAHPVQPGQKSPEWRVYTAASLLNRWAVDETMSMQRIDESGSIIAWKELRDEYEKEPKARPSTLQKTQPGYQQFRDSQALTLKRASSGKLPEYIVTIDSDEVTLLHGGDHTESTFDRTCTLVEIDLLSMRDLMTTYRDIVQTGQRNLKAKEILPLLDTMINHVRRLFTRSPRLFRMQSRALIANSKNTRYGVDYPNNFVTLTTSEGIRQLVDKSSEFFLSLDEAKADQAKIRPKFLQMLVLLLSFLNNDDLSLVKKVLESTFYLPGDRPNLELLIMKVLPLGSINPEVFLESLFAAYKPNGSIPRSFELPMHPEIWKNLHMDLVSKGYIMPVPVAQDMRSAQAPAVLGKGSLAKQREARRQAALKGAANATPEKSDRKTFLPVWPSIGYLSSTIFRDLQHDGVMRTEGDSPQSSLRGINEVPHLDISSEDQKHDLEAEFSNNVRYRVSPSDADDISAMKAGTYILSSMDQGPIQSYDLKIDCEILNQPFIDATSIVNGIVDSIRSFFGENQKKRGVFNRPAPAVFTPVPEPEEMRYFWATIVTPGEELKGSQCAEAYKTSDRVVVQDDIVREMNTSLRRLRTAVERLGKEIGRYAVKKVKDEATKKQHEDVQTVNQELAKAKIKIREAETCKSITQRKTRIHLDDPIKTVFYPSFAGILGKWPQWQKYVTELPDEEPRYLLVHAKNLTVEKAETSGKDNILILTFANCSISVSVEPLNPPASDGSPSTKPAENSQMLWMGKFLVAIKPVDETYKITGYFRVLSKDGGDRTKSEKISLDELEPDYFDLC